MKEAETSADFRGQKRKMEAETKTLSESGALLLETVRGIRRPDESFRQAVIERWDSLCKPLGGFGQLEDLIAQIGMIQRTEHPHLNKRAVVIMGADNGVVREGVSQCGSEVTAQVLENMGMRKSSVCVLSEALRADVFPVNIGMNVDASHPRVRNCAVRHGTGNIAEGPAMEREEAILAVETGIRMAGELKKQGYDLCVAGEMGIGNTTTSGACVCSLFSVEPEKIAGPGAGLSKAGVRKKAEVIRRALSVNQPNPNDPIDVLAKVGGLDLAGLCGLYLGCAFHSLPILIDGFISAVSADLAFRISKDALPYFLPSHESGEEGAKLVLQDLGLSGPIRAGMHLGEGTGAVLCLGLLDQILTVYEHLPRFEESSVEKYHHFDQ